MYGEKIFYWFVRRNQFGLIRIYILSEDKKIRLEFAPIDSEDIVEPNDIRRLLDDYFEARENI